MIFFDIPTEPSGGSGISGKRHNFSGSRVFQNGQLQEMVNVKQIHLRSHILITWWSPHIMRLIKDLRLPHLLQFHRPIVIVLDARTTFPPKTLKKLSSYSTVRHPIIIIKYLANLTAGDLKRSGVKTASHIFIPPPYLHRASNETFNSTASHDYTSIRIYRLIDTIKDIQGSIVSIVEHFQNIKFYGKFDDKVTRTNQRKKSKDKDDEGSFLRNPVYAAGNLTPVDAISNLTCQSWFNPYLLDVISLLRFGSVFLVPVEVLGLSQIEFGNCWYMFSEANLLLIGVLREGMKNLKKSKKFSKKLGADEIKLSLGGMAGVVRKEDARTYW